MMQYVQNHSDRRFKDATIIWLRYISDRGQAFCWCREHCKGFFTWTAGSMFVFTNKSDALLFKLTWG